MTASSNQNDFLEKCAFVRSCKRLSPDIANTAANQEVLYVLVMFELWVLKEMEWAIRNSSKTRQYNCEREEVQSFLHFVNHLHSARQKRIDCKVKLKKGSRLSLHGTKRMLAGNCLTYVTQ